MWIERASSPIYRGLCEPIYASVTTVLALHNLFRRKPYEGHACPLYFYSKTDESRDEDSNNSALDDDVIVNSCVSGKIVVGHAGPKIDPLCLDLPTFPAAKRSSGGYLAESNGLNTTCS